MCKPLYLILACVFVFSYEVCAIGRGTFQAKLRHCKWLCAIRDSQQKNTIQTCTVLTNHQNATISKCVSRCLVKHEEDIQNSTECQCENGKCKGKSTTSESTSSSPSSTEFSSLPTDSSSTSTEPPSSSSSSTRITSSEATPSTKSTDAPTTTTSSEPTTSSRLIENFENDEHDFPWL